MAVFDREPRALETWVSRTFSLDVPNFSPGALEIWMSRTFRLIVERARIASQSSFRQTGSVAFEFGTGPWATEEWIMPQQSILDSMASRQQGHVVTVSSGGNPTSTARNVRGIGCRIFNYGDGAAQAKMLAIDAAVVLLAGKGYPLPKTITFHLSSRNDTLKAPTEAFARKQDGSVGVEVFLGPNAMFSPPTPVSEGIAHKIKQYAIGDYTTTVVVHELGHVLHDIESTDYFWSSAAGGNLKGGDVGVAFSEISAYAATNPKEVVAEVFAAHNMGLKFSGSKVQSLYAKFAGPKLR